MHAKAKLRKVLESIENPPISGWFYRAVKHSALYSNDPPNPLYSLGPGKTGQRFTPLGGPPALYVADKAYTAFAEGTHAITSSLTGLIAPAEPQVLFAIDVRLEHVLDLTEEKILIALGTSRGELQGPWEDQREAGLDVPTHDLAEAAYQSGRFHSMKFDSLQNPGNKNLIIWTERIEEPYYVEVYDPSKKLAARIP
jgi:RES domain-containing protein